MAPILKSYTHVSWFCHSLPKRTKIVNLSVLTILHPFGPTGTFFDYFKQKLIFCSEAPQLNRTLGQQIHFCRKWPERVQKAQKGPKWSKIIQVDRFGPFWNTLYKPAIFGP